MEAKSEMTCGKCRFAVWIDYTPIGYCSLMEAGQRISGAAPCHCEPERRAKITQQAGNRDPWALERRALVAERALELAVRERHTTIVYATLHDMDGIEASLALAKAELKREESNADQND